MIMRCLISVILAFIWLKPASAQIDIQTMIGHKGYEFNAIYQNNFTPGSSLSYFGILDVNGLYDSLWRSDLNYYHTLSYELIKNAGLTFGNSFTNDDFLPHFGVYWGIENSSMNLSIIPSCTYSIHYEIIGVDLDLYFKKFWLTSKKWYPYSLLMVNGNLFSDGYSEISFLGNFGLSYRKKVNLGIGYGFNLTSEDDQAFHNLGVFVSYDFN